MMGKKVTLVNTIWFRSLRPLHIYLHSKSIDWGLLWARHFLWGCIRGQNKELGPFKGQREKPRRDVIHVRKPKYTSLGEKEECDGTQQDGCMSNTWEEEMVTRPWCGERIILLRSKSLKWELYPVSWGHSKEATMGRECLGKRANGIGPYRAW